MRSSSSSSTKLSALPSSSETESKAWKSKSHSPCVLGSLSLEVTTEDADEEVDDDDVDSAEELVELAV